MLLRSRAGLALITWMKLATYLAAHKLTEAQFAAAVGVASFTVSRWINGRQMPSLLRLIAISRATDGQVRKQDFSRRRAKTVP